MQARWFNLFNKEKHENDYKYGPVSFYKYRYHNKEIILIGERHGKIPAHLERQYYAIFHQFEQFNNHLKFFIEATNKRRSEKNDTDIGFIDCILNLSKTCDVNIVNADKRELPDGLERFYSFLMTMSELIAMWYHQCEMKRVKSDRIESVIQSIMQDERIKPYLYELAASGSIFTLPDWYEYIESQVKSLDEFTMQYVNENPVLKEFLVSCLLSTSEILVATSLLHEEYCALGFDRDQSLKRSLSEICIDLMIKKGDGSLFLGNELLEFFANHLDATLACDIWDELKSDHNSTQTIVVITGGKHTENLTHFLGNICETIMSYPETQNIIQPEMMFELLNNDSVSPSLSAL